jgi:hypothetical protein
VAHKLSSCIVKAVEITAVDPVDALRQPEGQDIVGKLILVKAYKFSDS